MKKTIIGSIAILVIATVAAFNIQLNTMDSKLSSISLVNVEALAKPDTPLPGNDGTKGDWTILSKEDQGKSGVPPKCYNNYRIKRRFDCNAFGSNTDVCGTVEHVNRQEPTPC